MKDNNVHISVVSPEYKGEKMVAELVRRIVESVSTITEDYEIILVNDASPDNSWDEIVKQCQLNSKVKGINLSRNFGQHYAITAGLSYSKGDWVVVMDCDLQDRPEEIPNLYRKAQEGWDVVFAQRKERRDGFFKKLSSSLFNSLFSILMGKKADKTIANFGIYQRKVIQAVLSMGDSVRSLYTMVQWVGFNQTAIPVEHSERAEGKSSYSFRKLLKLAFNYMIAFSDKPLNFVLRFGTIVFITSFAVAFYYLIRYLVGGITVSGFTTMVISVWMLGGIQIMLIGVVSLYIAKIFDRVKQRPLFIVDETVNLVQDK